MMIPMPMPAPIAMNTIVETPLREAEPLLADRREVDVVLDEHRQVEPVADHLERIEAALGHDVVGQRGDPAARLIHDPGRGDAERQRPPVNGAGLVDHLADHLEDLHADGAAAVLGGRPLQIADRLAEQVGRGDPDVASADVAADDEPRAGADHVRDRLASALAGAPAGRANESALLEPADRRRDRRLGKVRGRRDLRPGDRALAKDRLEHRLLAELPQQAQTRVGFGPTGRAITVSLGWDEALRLDSFTNSDGSHVA